MKSKTIKIVFTLAIFLAIVLIGYSVFAAQAQSRRMGQNLTVEEKSKIIDERVEEGVITSKKGQEIKTKLENCNPENPQRLGQEYKLNFGRANNSEGKGLGKQSGQTGQGLRNGTCRAIAE